MSGAPETVRSEALHAIAAEFRTDPARVDVLASIGPGEELDPLLWTALAEVLAFLIALDATDEVAA